MSRLVLLSATGQLPSPLRQVFANQRRKLGGVPADVVEHLVEGQGRVGSGRRLIYQRAKCGSSIYVVEMDEEAIRTDGLDAERIASRRRKVAKVLGDHDLPTGADGSRQNMAILRVVGHRRLDGRDD